MCKRLNYFRCEDGLLIFHTGDYVSHHFSVAKMPKMVKIGSGGPARQRISEMWVSNGVIFYFCEPLETIFLHRSTPFLHQVTCFGGYRFPRVWLLGLKFSPPEPKKKQLFAPFLDARKRFTMGMLQSKLALIIIVASWKLYSSSKRTSYITRILLHSSIWLAYYCLPNAIHCMGQNIKSLAACVCVCVCGCAHGIWGPNISKTIRDRGSVTMEHQ